jgi:hypothetical protein
LLPIVLTGSRGVIAISALVLILKKYSISSVLLLIIFLVAAFAVFNHRGEAQEDFGSFTPNVTINNSIIEGVGIVGRSASILVGLQVLQDTFPAGTHSVESSISKFNDYGYPTFAHSTALMIAINQGIIGLMLILYLMQYFIRLQIGLILSLIMIAFFLFSGGLVTSAKEIVLIWIILTAIKNSNTTYLQSKKISNKKA